MRAVVLWPRTVVMVVGEQVVGFASSLAAGRMRVRASIMELRLAPVQGCSAGDFRGRDTSGRKCSGGWNFNGVCVPEGPESRSMAVYGVSGDQEKLMLAALPIWHRNFCNASPGSSASGSLVI